MNRRDAIGSAAAATLTLTLDVNAAERPGILDVHAHVVPSDYAAFLEQHGVALPGMPPPPPGAPAARSMANPGDAPAHIAERLRQMDDAGIAVQILSPTITPFFQDAAVAVRAARIANDAMLEIAAGQRGRFRVFAVLPIPHLDAAQEELARMHRHEAVAGVTLSCFYGERSAADPYFDPLYAALDRAGSIVFLHPAVNGLCSRFITDWKLTAAAGATFEDCVIAMHLMVARIPARFPNIRFIVPHLGGGLATLVRRLDNQLPFFASLAEPPSRTVKRLWFDTCCHGSAPAMRSAIEAFGADRLLPGSDYPFLTLHEPYRDTLGFVRGIGLPADVVMTILERNAPRLFGAFPATHAIAAR